MPSRKDSLHKSASSLSVMGAVGNCCEHIDRRHRQRAIGLAGHADGGLRLLLYKVSMAGYWSDVHRVAEGIRVAHLLGAGPSLRNDHHNAGKEATVPMTDG